MEVYIVLTKTGTILSNIIKITKHHKYTHVSISLDKALKKMYSFGRLNPYNPFIGGFVHEGIHRGTFKRFSETDCVVLKLNVSKDQFNKLESKINYFKRNKMKFEFNVFGLVLVLVNKRPIRKNKFYCAEFVKYMLDDANIETNLPHVITPEDFYNLEGIEVIYEGKLRDYCYQ